MEDRFVKECPYCGGKEFAEASNAMAAMGSVSVSAFHSAKLHYCICLNCGSVVRTYVKDAENLKK